MDSKSPFVKASPRYSNRRMGILDIERKRPQDESAITPRRRKQARLSSLGGCQLCAGCRAIEFNSILRQHTLSSNGRSSGYVAASLFHFDPSQRTECALCTFLTKLVSTRASTQPTKIPGGYRLVSYSATKCLIPGAIKQLGHTDTPLLTVLPSIGRIPAWSRTDTPTMFCSIQPPSVSHGHSRGFPQHQLSFPPIEAKVDWRIAREWLNQCFTTHTKICQLNNTPHVALRLIDCRFEGDLRLTDTRGSSDKYVALSYVWGKTSSEDAPAQHSLKNAPLVVRDAATVVRALGFDFLWVDRYCIPQDEPQMKRRLIQNMGHVYRGSVLTLIAAAGEGPDFGLPGVSVCLRTQPRFQTNSYALSLLDMEGTSVVEESRWNSRAWTYQEMVFPARKLFFTSSGMYFQCQALTCTESISCPLKLVDSALVKKKSTYSMYSHLPTLFSPKFFDLGEFDSFEYHINKYHRRKLSFEFDALNACQGILQLEQEFSHILHLWGVPVLDITDNQLSLKYFLLGLLWYCDRVETGDLRADFPSWSWTGWRTHNCHGFRCPTLPSPSLYKVVTETSISVQFPKLSDSAVLPWNAEWKHILQQASESRGPPLLHIRAWSFELAEGSIGVDYGWSPDSQRFKWKAKGLGREYSGTFHMNQGAGALAGGPQREEILKLITLLEAADLMGQKSPFVNLLAVKMCEDQYHYQRVGVVLIQNVSQDELIRATGATLQEIILG